MRSALMTFAQRHPGALTAHFINGVRLKHKGSAGMIRETRQLKEVDLCKWATEMAGLTEIRDKRECLTLACVANYINSEEYAKAMDVITMRLHSVRKAKEKGGSWEQSQKMELVGEGEASLAPVGLAGLMA